MRYFGFDCTDEQMATYISGTGDKALKEGINSYLSANASDYEMVYASGDDRTYQIIKQELTKGNPVIIWDDDSKCGVMYRYKIGSAEESYKFYRPNGSGGFKTKGPIYDRSPSDLIVIRKK